MILHGKTADQEQKKTLSRLSFKARDKDPPCHLRACNLECRSNRQEIGKQKRKKRSLGRGQKRPTITASTASKPRESSKCSLRNEKDLEVLEEDGLTRKTKKSRTASSKSS
ncbi:Uncharacterized protein Fot_47871 [Forsythia ovata]|uniref:Uncharacterized protein n=1 Tax=Forsythia ovata TaxID=205694 RepID=A0ABD1QRL6_9LAMI